MVHKVLGSFLIIGLLSMGHVQAYTQASFVETHALGTTKANQLYFGIHTLSFIKNNEYFNPFILGHTLAGYQIQPYFRYYPATTVCLDVGVFTTRYWADTRFLANIVPTFTIKYVQQGFRFLLGNIEGGPAHRLINPLYDPERVLLGTPEPGLQLKYIKPNTFIDTWLDWRSLLCKHRGRPEEFCAGISFGQVLLKNPWFSVGLPIQVILYHLGGQGITTKDYSLLLGAIGSEITCKLNQYNWLKSLVLENYYVTSNYLKPVVRPFKNGQAFYSQLTLETPWFSLAGSYWQGHGFSSEQVCAPLYQSISLLDEGIKHQEPYRQLFVWHLSHEYSLAAGMSLALHLEPYYDFRNKLLEHSEGLYIIYRPFFKLATITPIPG